MVEDLRAKAGRQVTLTFLGVDGKPEELVVTLRPPEQVSPTQGALGIGELQVQVLDETFTRSPVEAAGTGWGVPRRLSAQTMPLTWMPNTVSGRMLGDYISVHYAGGRPLAVWVLANEPVGSSFRQAVYATRG
jgi:hypothetical protein